MSREIVTQDGEVIEQGGALALPDGYSEGNQPLAVALARAEVDQQITTAHAYPRNPKRAMSAILSLATLDEETAEECVYALPRGGKPIKGPSVRLAEIIAGQWGNARVGARVVHVDKIEKYVEAEGVFHDLETNVATTARVRRRISGKDGRVFNDDMIVVTGNAACAIAKRNAILGAVPKAVWRKAYDAVEAVIAGDVKTLSERREKAMKAFAAFGVTPEQIFAALDVEDLEGITIDHITTLTGMHAALKSGESTVEEMFPKTPSKGDAPKGTKAKLDKLAEGGKADEGEEKPKPRGSTRKETEAEEIPGRKSKRAEPKDEGQDDDEALIARAEEILDQLGFRPAGIDPDDPMQVIAFDEGMTAFEQGIARRAVPDEYRGKGELSAAWQKGHDEAAAASHDGDEGED